MLIPFIKMQAQGNDFVILDTFEQQIDAIDYASLAVAVCDRHFGVGADGLVIVGASMQADARMTIYNNDGSLAEMCGSALRCVAQLLMDKLKKSSVMVQTDSGIKEAWREAKTIHVNLGVAQMIQSSMLVESFCGDLVDIGNPHFVVFTDTIQDNPHLQYGAILEHHQAFPKPVNVHFVKIHDRSNLEMKIWEHACGATLACGTGAASSVFAGIMHDLLERKVSVKVPGGKLTIEMCTDDSLLLAGSVEESFRGIYLWKTSVNI
ncbi:MAG: diaminopimelate epimerase [Candidatus Cloacimonetes bacterium]|nr:diaminopimelate epimerase [Candidatus Cloacimonadota bacterium]MDY0298509.1 diaminopimelate epimerase [Candidatus Cloacimonadaceae bacterium]MCK9332590.1 diaminopimelate epimerase [Candidatus Cloacimonadota bacterium]MDD2209710.1 diaminopimelate epimerase [Candidatus Cloacimonadota bacterium]MDD3282595.1 diaminopimelate epimerase [Candidatus Cloacimonadota bacterium]